MSALTKENLAEIGLDETQASKVLELVKSKINEKFIPKERFDEINSQKNGLKSQLDERDKQINELKSFKGNVDELNEKIKSLQAENQEKQKAYETQLRQEKLTSAMKFALNGKAYDPDLTISQIDMGKVSISENGDLIGFNDQIDTLKNQKSFLFVNDGAPQVKITGKAPETSVNSSFITPPKEDSIGKKLAMQRQKEMQNTEALSKKFFGIN
jgi:vacuolar-type H+-ATPase subunit I/STV1